MISRYVKLNDAWLLRGWTDVNRVLVNWENGDCRHLGKDGLYVAESCDGQTDFGSIAFLPRHIDLLNKFIAEGIARECGAGDTPKHIQRYRQANNPMIRGIHWAITGLCNMNCRFCFMEAPSGRYSQPDLKTVFNLLNQFERANVLNVSLTGGEPLLRQDLPEIIEQISNKRIRLTEIVTNGTLITPNLLHSIRQFGQRPDFKISFDGTGVHDILRGTHGTEERVKDSIRLVLSAGFPVAVTTTVDQDNLAALPATYELMKDLHVPVWLIGRPQTTGNWCGSATAVSTEVMAKACMDLLKRWLADGRPFHIMLERFFGGGTNTGAQYPNSHEVSFGLESYECDAIREKPYLLPDGTLLPCTGYTGTLIHENMPNLLKHELSEVWSNSSLRTLAEMKKNEVLAANSECQTCEMFSACGAGCRAYALTETGLLLAKDPVACAAYKGGYRRLFAETAKRAAAFS